MQNASRLYGQLRENARRRMAQSLHRPPSRTQRPPPPPPPAYKRLSPPPPAGTLAQYQHALHPTRATPGNMIVSPRPCAVHDPRLRLAFTGGAASPRHVERSCSPEQERQAAIGLSSTGTAAHAAAAVAAAACHQFDRFDRFVDQAERIQRGDRLFDRQRPAAAAHAQRRLRAASSFPCSTRGADTQGAPAAHAAGKRVSKTAGATMGYSPGLRSSTGSRGIGVDGAGTAKRDWGHQQPACGNHWEGNASGWQRTTAADGSQEAATPAAAEGPAQSSSAAKAGEQLAMSSPHCKAHTSLNLGLGSNCSGSTPPALPATDEQPQSQPAELGNGCIRSPRLNSSSVGGGFFGVETRSTLDSLDMLLMERQAQRRCSGRLAPRNYHPPTTVEAAATPPAAAAAVAAAAGAAEAAHVPAHSIVIVENSSGEEGHQPTSPGATWQPAAEYPSRLVPSSNTAAAASSSGGPQPWTPSSRNSGPQPRTLSSLDSILLRDLRFALQQVTPTAGALVAERRDVVSPMPSVAPTTRAAPPAAKLVAARSFSDRASPPLAASRAQTAQPPPQPSPHGCLPVPSSPSYRQPSPGTAAPPSRVSSPARAAAANVVSGEDRADGGGRGALVPEYSREAWIRSGCFDPLGLLRPEQERRFDQGQKQHQQVGEAGGVSQEDRQGEAGEPGSDDVEEWRQQDGHTRGLKQVAADVGEGDAVMLIERRLQPPWQRQGQLSGGGVSRIHNRMSSSVAPVQGSMKIRGQAAGAASGQDEMQHRQQVAPAKKAAGAGASEASLLLSLARRKSKRHKGKIYRMPPLPAAVRGKAGRSASSKEYASWDAPGHREQWVVPAYDSRLGFAAGLVHDGVLRLE